MVAYSFKARFAQPILDGVKKQTIRADRRRHAHPGEELQLYTGRKLIACAICKEVVRVEIDFRCPQVLICREGGWSILKVEDFARADGFSSFHAMAEFWLSVHGATSFHGFMIRWDRLL
jgi:hypothetical protein